MYHTYMALESMLKVSYVRTSDKSSDKYTHQVTSQAPILNYKKFLKYRIKPKGKRKNDIGLPYRTLQYVKPGILNVFYFKCVKACTTHTIAFHDLEHRAFMIIMTSNEVRIASCAAAPLKTYDFIINTATMIQKIKHV